MADDVYSQTGHLSKNFTEFADGIKVSNVVRSVREIGQPAKAGEFNQQEARGIYIRGYGITSATDPNPVLGTKGMGPCVAVAIYNPKTKMGALAHFDTNTDVESMDKMLYTVRDDADDPLEVHLAGGALGEPNSHRLVEEIVSRLNDEPNLKIKSAELLNPSGSLKSLALDTRTGEISNQFMGSQLNNGDRSNIMSYHVGHAFQKEGLRPEYINGVAMSVADWEAAKPKPQMASVENALGR